MGPLPAPAPVIEDPCPEPVVVDPLPAPAPVVDPLPAPAPEPCDVPVVKAPACFSSSSHVKSSSSACISTRLSLSNLHHLLSGSDELPRAKYKNKVSKPMLLERKKDAKVFNSTYSLQLTSIY